MKVKAICYQLGKTILWCKALVQKLIKQAMSLNYKPLSFLFLSPLSSLSLIFVSRIIGTSFSECDY